MPSSLRIGRYLGGLSLNLSPGITQSPQRKQLCFLVQNAHFKHAGPNRTCQVLQVLQTRSSARLGKGLKQSTTSQLSAASIVSPLRRPGLRQIFMARMQSRSHGAHSHHHHDNIYLTSTNKKDAGVRITRIGLYSNLGMAIAKAAGGYAFNSQSMIADAWHSLTDLASDILTLATVSWSTKAPTKDFPMGFGKVESLGSLGVSSMLLVGGMFMCLHSSELLYAHFFLDASAAAELLEHGHHGHSHSSHSHTSVGPSLHAAWLAAGTVVIKEWLYHKTMKVAQERRSSVLASNAVHHRVDSLTGIVTLLVILASNLIKNAMWLDPVGGLLISLMVIKAGWSNTCLALFELADKSIDHDFKHSVRKQVDISLDAVKGGHDVELLDISGVKSGQNYLIDLGLAVPSSWTVEETRKTEEMIRTQVGSKVRGVRRVRVRFIPRNANRTDKFDEFIPVEISLKTYSDLREHEYKHDDDKDHEHKHNDGHDHRHGHDHDKFQ